MIITPFLSSISKFFNFNKNASRFLDARLDANLPRDQFKDKEGKWFGYPTGETTTLSNLDEKEFSVQGLGVATMTHSDSSLGGPITITVNNNSTSSGGASWD